MQKQSVDAQKTLEKFNDQILAASHESDVEQRHTAVTTLVENVVDECKSRSLFYQILQLVLFCTIFLNAMIVMHGYYNSKITLAQARAQTSMPTAKSKINDDLSQQQEKEWVNRLVENSPYRSTGSSVALLGDHNTIQISGGLMMANPGLQPHLVPHTKE